MQTKTVNRLMAELAQQYPLSVELFDLIKTYLGYAYAVGYDRGRDRRDLKLFNRFTKSKAVVRMSMNGKVLQRYSSVTTAARLLGVDKTAISKVLRGVNKSCKGYGWRYENETTKRGGGSV